MKPPGQVIVVHFPLPDLTASKLRPAVVPAWAKFAAVRKAVVHMIQQGRAGA